SRPSPRGAPLAAPAQLAAPRPRSYPAQDPLCYEVNNLGIRPPQRPQHLRSVLPQDRAGRPAPRRRVREMDRGADLLDVAQLRMQSFPEEVARLQLRVVEDLIVGQDLGAGHARFLQQRYPVRPRLTRRHLFDHRDQNVTAHVTRGVVLESLLYRPFRVDVYVADRTHVPWIGSTV